MKKAVGWVVIVGLSAFWTSVLFQRFVQDLYGFGVSELTLGQLFGELLLLAFFTILSGFGIASLTLFLLLVIYAFISFAVIPLINKTMGHVDNAVEWLYSCVGEAVHIDKL